MTTTSFTAGSEFDLNTALSEIDLGGSDAAPGTAYTITLSADILEGTDTGSGLPPDLYAVNLPAGSSLTIEGDGHAIDGNTPTFRVPQTAYRGLFVYAGTVTIQNVTIRNTIAAGGYGGPDAGGGAGLGGGLLVASAATVTLSGVVFAGDQAIGGAGGYHNGTDGGGGGLGGNGGELIGGGGGIGATAIGGAVSWPAGPGLVLGAASGGGGGGPAGGGGAVTLDATNTYRGGTVLNGGTLELALPGAAGTGAIQFANGASATLQIDGSTMPTNTITGFAEGDTILLANLAPLASTPSLNANNQLSVPTSGGTVTLQLGPFFGLGVSLTAEGSGTAITAACFAAGTRIATPRGMVRVERLRQGDVVVTVSGGRQPIQWIGRREVDCRRHPNRERVWPIRITPHAFGEGRPTRALLLSPDHSVFVEDVLIPVKALVNDTTVKQIETDTITYYHIELDRHDVMLAEGRPAESYLETGGRHAFENAGTTMQLHPDFEPDPARVAMVWKSFGYAPLLGDGSHLERAKRKLALQAALLNHAARISPRHTTKAA